jgi:DNA/RNA endonuclease G (NUC1)
MYVITGSVYQAADPSPIKVSAGACPTTLTLPAVNPASICPENQHNKSTPCAAGVSVPAGMFKIVYDPVMQNAFAVLMENENHTGKYKKGADYIEAHRVSIGTLEDLTGLTFFTALPARKQQQMRSTCVDVKMH